ncbi:MAG: hypothetical protein K2O34_11010 [Acetatifactor sp.]|nr:hypothetical protein [Acetatifactor sp.]
MSHTAIISRELGKPAVVGADHATRLLRSGDLVEVDGDTGQITVIRRKEEIADTVSGMQAKEKNEEHL